MDEQTIDKKIAILNRRAEMFDRHIQRFQERKQRFTDEIAVLQSEKAKVKKDK